MGSLTPEDRIRIRAAITPLRHLAEALQTETLDGES